MTAHPKSSIEERLQRHPHLRQRFEHILDIIEAPSGQVDTADEAEQRVIEELRRLGHEVLHQWAADKETQQVTELEVKDHKFTHSAKKNSGGTRRSEP
jgi:hypothetical protein